MLTRCVPHPVSFAGTQTGKPALIMQCHWGFLKKSQCISALHDMAYCMCSDRQRSEICTWSICASLASQKNKTQVMPKLVAETLDGTSVMRPGEHSGDIFAALLSLNHVAGRMSAAKRQTPFSYDSQTGTRERKHGPSSCDSDTETS